MFADAISQVSIFTRPIHSISRYYGSTEAIPGAATLFFVNEEGWALTCGHVARQLIAAGQLAEKYKQFRNELKSSTGEMNKNKLLKELEKKHGYNKKTVLEIKNRFINCVEGKKDEGKKDIDIRLHKTVDIALLQFKSFDRLLCENFPTFAADITGLKQGKFLCRLGFPFPEFTNYAYSEENETIDWIGSGKDTTPQFPLEGMLTRHILGNDNAVVGFEMSTPGLRGQSGGPVFDKNGVVWGMQAATAHLDLDFDLNQEVLRQGIKKRVTDSAFLHVGHCIHLDVIKSFMKENKVTFNEV